LSGPGHAYSLGECSESGEWSHGRTTQKKRGHASAEGNTKRVPTEGRSVPPLKKYWKSKKAE